MPEEPKVEIPSVQPIFEGMGSDMELSEEIEMKSGLDLGKLYIKDFSGIATNPFGLGDGIGNDYTNLRLTERPEDKKLVKQTNADPVFGGF